MTLADIKGKYGSAVCATAYRLCDLARRNDERNKKEGRPPENSYETIFRPSLLKHHPSLTDEDISALYNYGMIETR
ncbi:MAG: hypothetical protein GC185_11555 [Alphaproteobacteria bacterium]|nr:hypothetical protein [Alphaproteobacteria bacterium]